MSFSLVAFDLDGTLVDSSIDITNAINYAIEPFGVAPVTVAETISLIGEGVTRLIEKLVTRSSAVPGRQLGQSDLPPEHSLDKDLLLRRFIDHYSVHLIDHTTVYPGVRETLDHLKGYKKAVISNKREDLSVRTLEELGLARHLDLIVGSDTTPERKPSPVPVLHVLEMLGAKKDEALIVGDSNYDIEAGRAAGITTVGVTYGYRPVDVLKDADFIIDRMPELINILTNNGAWQAERDNSGVRR